MTFEPTNAIPGEDDDQSVPHQQQREADPYRHPAVADEARALLASSSKRTRFGRVFVEHLLAEHDALATRVAELEAHPAQLVRADCEADEADVRAVDAVAAAEDDEALDRAISNLIARFADRIAALDASADGGVQ